MTTLQEHWNMAIGRKHPTQHYLYTFRGLAQENPVVVEFGCLRGFSATAWLMGGATVHSYDIKKQTLLEHPNFHFHLKNTLEIKEIPHCDLLFIDSDHTYNQVKAELRFAKFVRKRIVFHDVVIFGHKDGPDKGAKGPGILPAIHEFLRDNPEWEKEFEILDRIGLLCLKRKNIEPV